MFVLHFSATGIFGLTFHNAALIIYAIVVSSIFITFESLYFLFTLYICYRIDCCKIICYNIGNRKFQNNSVMLMKDIAKLNYEIFR